MSFPTAITLAGDSSSSQTYDVQSIEGGKSIRGDATRGLALPRSMTISHATTAKGSQTSDRHLVRLDLAVADATTGEKVNMSVQVVLELPRTVATVAQLKDMVTQIKNFLIDANITKLLNGEP
jgi:hypothetical protein